MRRGRDQIRFGDSEIAYEIIRGGNRRNVSITVHPNLSVMVAVPKGMLKATIAGAVKKKATWIIRQRQRFLRFAGTLAKEFVSGESFYYLGRQYQLKVQQVKNLQGRPKVHVERGRFAIKVFARWGKSIRQRYVREALTKWYREHALNKIGGISARLAQKVRCDNPAIRIHEMEKRWASCGKGGVLRFNWRIIMAKPAVLEYVVAHEMCHLKYRNHSAAFWRLLRSLMPDYESRKEQLARDGAKYNF